MVVPGQPLGVWFWPYYGSPNHSVLWVIYPRVALDSTSDSSGLLLIFRASIRKLYLTGPQNAGRSLTWRNSEPSFFLVRRGWTGLATVESLSVSAVSRPSFVPDDEAYASPFRVWCDGLGRAGSRWGPSRRRCQFYPRYEKFITAPDSRCLPSKKKFICCKYLFNLQVI